ncbi:MAG TPA: glycosyl hydrolase family 65 protein [Armatimonadota bacterium]
MNYNDWIITNTDTTAHALEAANSVFTISNGYLAVKGNLLERREGRCPTTIVAGIFGEADMTSSIPPNGAECRYLDAGLFDEPKLRPSVANLPNPLYISVRVDGEELTLESCVVSDFRQFLDLRTGEYRYRFEITPKNGRTFAILMERIACMERINTVAMRYTVTSIDYSGPVAIRAGVDASVRSNLHGEKQFDIIQASPESVRVRLAGSGAEVETRTHSRISGVKARDRAVEVDAFFGVEWDFDIGTGRQVVVEQIATVTTSEDERLEIPIVPRHDKMGLHESGYDHALSENWAWWDKAWERADVEIEGDDLAQRYIRFCLFQLISAAPRHTDKLSVPCKLLTGEWYQGSVFYDTDLYILPFYTFVMPEVAKRCLNYRYLGLDNGRAIAKRLGYAGAKFAWQSGPSGEEVLGPWYRFVHTNIHIDSDVAYALNLYKNATADSGFMREKRIDILVESARFYASRAVRDGEVYHLKDVSGPDEGHCESTDNFYTNVMAAKTLRWAAGTLDQLSQESPESAAAVKKRLHIGDGEPDAWRRVANGLRLIFDPATKVYEQYDGFHALKPIPPGFREDQKEWWFTVHPYQAIHQPDVVMAMTLLREDYPDDVYAANRDFYGERSMDFSSMSHVIHCLAAKDVGDMDEAYRQFIITAGEDLDESLTGRGDTADGLHGTATGGAWMAAVFGFGGVRLTDAGLTINPALPAHWKALRFNIWLRGEKLRFEVTQTTLRITVGNDASLEMPAVIFGQKTTLRSGETFETMSS